MSEATVISMRGGVIAVDVAEAEFQRFADTMDLDFDVDRMDASDRKSFEETKHVVTRAIERGTLRIDDQGQPVYTPRTPGVASDEITFYEPTGATFIQMDSKKRDADHARSFALLADMTRQPEKRFAQMGQRDLKVCRALVSLFLG